MAAGLPAASPVRPPGDDEDVKWCDVPRALGDDEGCNIRRILRIRRSTVPRKRFRKESTPLDGDADDSRIAVEIADGSGDDRRRRSRKSLMDSKVCNYSDCIPRWEETWGLP